MRNRQWQYINSRSKSNQTMKFGQLIEYYMRNIFLKYHAQNVAEKQMLFRRFSKKFKLSIFLDL